MANHSLLAYFTQELEFLKQESVRFANAHPDAAMALGIKTDGIDDPEYMRLIESVAFLNGRLQQQLAQNYPDLTQSLLDLLYPDYSRALPSFSRVDFQVKEGTKTRHQIPKQTEFELTDLDGKVYSFMSCQTLDLLPCLIADVRVVYPPFDFEKPLGAERADAMIEIRIQTTHGDVDFSQLEIDELTIYLKGENAQILSLCDVFLHATQQVSLQTDRERLILGKHCISPIGFDDDSRILPSESKSFTALSLVKEFFAYPEKHYGFKIDLSTAQQMFSGQEIQLQFYVKDLSAEFAHRISVECFSLFVGQILNLYSQVLEPIAIDFRKNQYPIRVEADPESSKRLYKITHITDITDRETFTVPGLYQEKYAYFDDANLTRYSKNKTPNQIKINSNHPVQAVSHLRWQCTRARYAQEQGLYELKVAALMQGNTASGSPNENGEKKGSDCSHRERIWQMDALVMDQLNAAMLTTNSPIALIDNISMPADLILLQRPTPLIHGLTQANGEWNLLSHLHLNYQTIFEHSDSVKSLQSLFALYTSGYQSRFQTFIDAIQQLDSTPIVAPIRVGNHTCFVYGTQIQVILSKNKIQHGLALFSHFLDAFFSYFTGSNSFSQLSVYLESQDDLYLAFPRRNGCKQII